MLLVSPAAIFAAPSQDSAKPPEARQLVEAWFTRWNALDGTPATTQALVDLYASDALHSTAPASHQLGTVTFRGHDGIRKMVEAFVAAFEKPKYRLEAVTAKEQTAHLFNTVEGPWGGASVAVEFSAVYTAREDGKRYVWPGAAFFQLENGKIRRLRLYMASGEQTEVEPEVQRRRRPQ
jgi:ketosteroid isomerase-like protein